MRIISRRRLREFWTVHPKAEKPLEVWYKIARVRHWTSLVEVRQDFRHADPVGPLTVFNIGGNDFRLLTQVVYRIGVIYIKGVVTHSEYDKLKLR